MDSIRSELVGKVERIASLRAPAPVSTGPQHEPSAVSPAGLVKQLASAPPVDLDHVARVKQALANGSYSISPEAVADRLLGFKQEWRGNDPA